MPCPHRWQRRRSDVPCHARIEQGQHWPVSPSSIPTSYFFRAWLPPSISNDRSPSLTVPATHRRRHVSDGHGQGGRDARARGLRVTPPAVRVPSQRTQAHSAAYANMSIVSYGTNTPAMRPARGTPFSSAAPVSLRPSVRYGHRTARSPSWTNRPHRAFAPVDEVKTPSTPGGKPGTSDGANHARVHGQRPTRWHLRLNVGFPERSDRRLARFVLAPKPDTTP